MFFNDLIFIFILLVYSYFQNRLFLYIADKNKLSILSDNDFSKPQAFHLKPTLRLGGITFFLQLIIIFLYLFFFKNISLPDYIYYCTLFFLIGLADDLKINLLPKFRLFLMIVFLLALTISSGLYIEKTGLTFLNNLLEIDIFALFFVCLCFLFIINGSNLIDGFNGLLGIHSLIIFTVLFFINFINGNEDIAFLLLFLCLLSLVFLKFNFPNAKKERRNSWI